MQTEKQRERLVELLKETFEYTRGTCIDFDEAAEINADYLMSNNVVVLPCKAGDIIYIIGEITGQIVYDIIHHIMYNGKEFCLVTESGVLVLVEQQLGKTVFLSRAEAENVLKERKENGK